MIDRFVGDYAFLSNLAACRVWFADPGDPPVEFRSVEHAFQAAKTVDPVARNRIARTPSPVIAKRIGRRVTLRPGWNELRLSVMDDLVRQKFGEEPFRSRLLGTGDTEIIEGNRWHDQFWGSCQCPAHINVPAENHLGQTLMRVRSTLAG